MNIRQAFANKTKQHILLTLLKSESSRYSKLMPKNVDNILFNYHLQHLVKLGFICKKDSTYKLSQLGIEAMDNIAPNGMFFPKFTARYKMYLIKNDTFLYQEVSRVPNIKNLTPISSKLLRDTYTEKRANLRIKQKTNIKAKMKCVGVYRKHLIKKNGDPLEDNLYFICYADRFEGMSNKHNDNNEKLIWLTLNQAINAERKNNASGKVEIEILKKLTAKNYEFTFYEDTVVI